MVADFDCEERRRVIACPRCSFGRPDLGRDALLDYAACPATLTYKRLVEQIVMVIGDSDFVPAAKIARREGIDVVLDPLGLKLHANLHEHTDGVRTPTMPMRNMAETKAEKTKFSEAADELRPPPLRGPGGLLMVETSAAIEWSRNFDRPVVVSSGQSEPFREGPTRARRGPGL